MICSQCSCSSFQGTQLAARAQLPFTRTSRQQQRQQRAQPSALFKRKPEPAKEPPPPPPKKGLFSFGKKAEQAEPVKQAKGALGKAAKAVKKAAPQKPKQSFLEALDFSEVRSYEDAKLLSDARYGARGEDGKMTREQYNALRRKVGGTAKSFFKESVEAQGKYLEKGYVSREQTSVGSGVPGLPFLIAVVVALFGALGYVVSQTS